MYQRSLNGTYNIFPTNDAVSCYATSCVLRCTVTESPIKRDISFLTYRSTQEYHILSKSSRRYGSLFTPLKVHSGRAQIYTNQDELDKLLITPAKCNTHVEAVMGCSSCDDKNYVILSSKNITAQGTLYLKSNCSIRPNYFTCQVEPYQVEVVGDTGICSVYIFNTPGKRGSPIGHMYIQLNYTFTNALSPITILANSTQPPSAFELTQLLITSPGDTKGIGMVFGGLTSIVAIVRGILFIKGITILSTIFTHKSLKTTEVNNPI